MIVSVWLIGNVFVAACLKKDQFNIENSLSMFQQKQFRIEIFQFSRLILAFVIRSTTSRRAAAGIFQISRFFKSAYMFRVGDRGKGTDSRYDRMSCDVRERSTKIYRCSARREAKLPSDVIRSVFLE